MLDVYLENNDLTTSHEVILENLNPATVYYVRPVSNVDVESTPTKFMLCPLLLKVQEQ